MPKSTGHWVKSVLGGASVFVAYPVSSLLLGVCDHGDSGSSSKEKGKGK